MFRFVRDVLWQSKTATRSRRWLQISLRGALAVFTLLGLFFGWYANRAWRQKLAVGAIRAQGGRVWYSSEETAENLPPRPPPFLARYLGLDFVDSAVKVDFIGQEFDDADVLLLNDLPRLEQLQLHQTRITGSTFERVRTLRMIKRLRTNYTPLTDDAIAHFRHSKLDYFMILNGAISDRTMEYLGTCKNLNTLWITNAPITDGGMQHVSGLRQLTNVRLNYTRITDKGLLAFTDHPTLLELKLEHNTITDEGVAYLGRPPRLRFLKLEDTLVTPECCDRLRTTYGRQLTLAGPRAPEVATPVKTGY